MADKWIAKAIKHPGALTAAAKKAGALAPDGTIKKAWVRKQAGSGSPQRSAQAQLALNLAKMRQRK
jgi:hypothetical protein